MSKKPKAQKVSLSQFLDTGDSWADDVSDLPSAPAASAPTTTTQVEYSRPTFGESRGGDRYESDRAPREDIPIPDEPPFTAYVGNLSFSTTEAEVKAFFSESSVSSVRLLTDGRTGRPKGFGYVEFGARKDLEKALSFNQRELNGRNVRINVAEGSKRVDKFAGNWRQKPAEGAPRAFKEQFDNRNAFGGERQSSGYERPSGFGGRQSSFGSERQSGEKPASGWPKKDVAPKPAGVEAAKPPAPKPKSNPFGAAIESAQKRDQYAIEQEFEKRRLEREAERKAAAAAPVQKETKAWGAKKEFKKKEDAAPQTSWRRQGPVEKKTPTDKPTGEYTAFGATKRKAVKSTVSTTENTPAASAQGSRQNVYELLEVDLIN